MADRDALVRQLLQLVQLVCVCVCTRWVVSSGPDVSSCELARDSNW